MIDFKVMYSLMEQAWNMSLRARPTFGSMVQTIRDHVHAVYDYELKDVLLLNDEPRPSEEKALE